MTDRAPDLDWIVATAAGARLRQGYGFRPGLLGAAREAVKDIDPTNGEATCDAIHQVFRDYQLSETTGETK